VNLGSPGAVLRNTALGFFDGQGHVLLCPVL